MDERVRIIKECFTADAETGGVFWAERPRHHFSSEGFWSRNKRDIAGRPVKPTVLNSGHLQAKVYVLGANHRFLFHRIVWALARGEYPDGDIDHVDGDPKNNALSNLRVATRAQNAHNARKIKGGRKGAHRAPNGRWISTYWGGEKLEYLGTFDTEAEAHTAWVVRAVADRGEFFNAGYASVFD